MASALQVDTAVESMAAEIDRIFKRIGIKSSLIDYGIDKSKSDLIADSSITTGRADNNIVDFNKSDLAELINCLF